MPSALDDLEYPDSYTPPADARALTGLAQEAEAARQAQRFVPANRPVAPMVPTDPTGAPLQGPYQPSAPSLTMQQYAPGSDDTATSAATRAILAERPEDNPFYARGSRNPDRGAVTPNIVLTPPTAPEAPEVMGPPAPPSGKEALVSPEGAEQTGGIVTAPLPGRKPELPAEAPEPPKTLAKKETDWKGAPAAVGPATGGERPRDAYPPANEKQLISPRAYIDLEKANPVLYQNITHAAATVGVSPWALTNIMLATSGGDPNASRNGRIGLTGVTAEDVANFQKAMPQLFVDPDGKPISPTDPHLNLLLGALKYKQTNDLYGANTRTAIESYFAGTEAANAVSRGHDPIHLGDATELTKKAIDPHNPESVKLQPSIPAGTATPLGVAQAAAQAARTGDARVFGTYMINNVPRGMSNNDGWRHVEALLTSAFIAKGDMEGAQRAREMIFQQSQVGTTQALMRAYQALDAGDSNAAASQLAQAYFFAPDGGQAKIHVMKDGSVWAQRYNEATGEQVGQPFNVTKEKIASMLNVTRDPQAFMKHIREEQTAMADIALKREHAQYYRNQPVIQAGHDITSLQRNAATNERATLISREQAANRDAIAQFNAQAHYTTATDVAQIGRQGADKGVANDEQIGGELQRQSMGLGLQPGTTTPGFSAYAGYYQAMRRNRIPEVTAMPLAKAFADKTGGDLQVQHMSDGTVNLLKGGQLLANLPSGTVAALGLRVPQPPAATAAPAAGG